MKRSVAVVFALCLLQQAFPQGSSKDIMEKVAAVYSANAGFLLDFTLKTEDTKAKVVYTHDGKASIKGNKFKIEVPDGTTWFDGKTQWVYMNGSDEVNVSEPVGEELAAISPVALLNLYKTGFKLSDKKQKKEAGKILYIIEMTPKKKNGEITKIVLSVDSSNYYITSILLQGKDKVNNRLLIRKQVKTAALGDNIFVFNPQDYPDAEIVDLR
ncbi:MAG: outer-membrane lipoprotein carrier protein LolA [Prevotella sp.]|nr:outer-membrane lipoprotein carrier protein LolA [Prevotella sp.]